MPSISLKTSVRMGDDAKKKLLGALSQIIAEATGKPVQYVMAMVEQTDMVLARDMAPCAFADVRSIGGLDRGTNARISESVCGLLEKELGVAPSRVYLNFTELKGENWGFDSGVFG
jgi:phenylpyruvate tautomerase PptA (4-oxalocrotonate tautomerase family)